MQYYPIFEKTEYKNKDLPIHSIWNILCDDNNCFNAHWNQELEFIYIENGEGCVVIEQQKYFVSEGDLLIVSPQKLHSGFVVENSRMSCMVVAFDLNMLQDIQDNSLSNKIIQMIQNGSLVFQYFMSASNSETDILVSIVKKIFHTTTNFEKRNIFNIKYLLNELIAKLIEFDLVNECKISNKNSDDNIKIVIQYIFDNYQNKISNDVLADLVHYSKCYFFTYFKKCVGVTVVNFINEVRLSKSIELLVRSNKNMLEIAMFCGFNSGSYFNECFMKRYHMTPIQFRNTHISKE